MVNSKEYLEKNREAINQQRRERYNSEARKRRYYEKRDTMLQRCREDKAMCPLCRIEYHRRYGAGAVEMDHFMKDHFLLARCVSADFKLTLVRRRDRVKLVTGD